jgi:ATP-binding cassette subfamily G (WHITE) protein 2 (PDR)
MADLNSNSENATRTTSQMHTTSYNSTSGVSQSNTTGQQSQSTVTSGLIHTTGIYRTSSGRETYYPDGHESRANQSGVALFCEHDEHQQTPAPITRSSYGLFPSQENNTQQSSESRASKGAGLFSNHDTQPEQSQSSNNAQQFEQEVPLEKVESSSSSDSSTQYGSNGPHNKKRRESSMLERRSTEGRYSIMLERRNTRTEIDDEGRRELQRIFTTQSQKMSRQISIAQPGDATVNPSSESFDLSRFLKMFRKLAFHRLCNLY